MNKPFTLFLTLSLLMLLGASNATAETCPTFRGRSAKRGGGTANPRCVCPRGFQRGDVRTLFRERGVDLARQCKKARIAAYKRCLKQGRVVQFKSRVLRSRLKVVMGYSRGYCIVRYACRWSKYKKFYFVRGKLSSFKVVRQVVRRTRKKVRSCAIFWKTTVLFAGGKKKLLTGRFLQKASGRKVSKKVLCDAAVQRVKKQLSKKLVSRRFFCTSRR